MLDIVGKTIGRYEIQAHIGEGGMAQVFRAYDPGIQRAGALKILKEEHCQDEEHMRRFLQEGKAAGALTHPNIVTIYDVGSLEGAPYIMMELLEGETLGEILAKGEKLPLEVILDCAAQIADALDYAHSKGVVHRDMKPDNIILDSKRKIVKIADFGIARIEEGNKETTMVGLMMGTPRYMSPEQASGIVVDGRSDLFAMGVILYEMITGQKAFDAESMPTLILQIVQKNPIPIPAPTPVNPSPLQNPQSRQLSSLRQHQRARSAWSKPAPQPNLAPRSSCVARSAASSSRSPILLPSSSSQTRRRLNRATRIPMTSARPLGITAAKRRLRSRPQPRRFRSKERTENCCDRRCVGSVI